MKKTILASALTLVAGLLMVPATTLYFESGRGTGCTSCHEMQAVYDRWHSSSHRGIACEKCHGGALTMDASFHVNNMNRAYSHLRGDLAERVEFGNKYVQAMSQQCENCHRQEYASWHAGPHSASYARIFLDKKHNTENMLMDDCLRCHGMYFEGGIGNLVQPVSRTGPGGSVGRGTRLNP